MKILLCVSVVAAALVGGLAESGNAASPQSGGSVLVGNAVLNSIGTSASGWQALSSRGNVSVRAVQKELDFSTYTTSALEIDQNADPGEWSEVLGDLNAAMITAGNAYRVQMWVRDLDAAGTPIGILLADANYGSRPSNDEADVRFTDTNWHQVRYDFVADRAAGANTKLYLRLPSGENAAHVQFTRAKVAQLVGENSVGTVALPPSEPGPVTPVTSPVLPVSPAGPTGPSGETMPIGDLAGWHQIFTDDFSKPAAPGQFLTVYGPKWGAYDGFSDTRHVGQYSQNVLSSDGSMLTMHLHTEGGVPQVAAPAPLIHGVWGGQLYGRYEVRFRADALHGYSTAWLLWPDSDSWPDGEIDFPEGDLAGTISAYNHTPGNPSVNASAADSGVTYQDWHTATTEWTPAGVKFYLDGRLFSSSPVSPSKPMHMVLQTETNDDRPDPSLAGDVQIDWVSIWQYAP